jgi:hypothetical protein
MREERELLQCMRQLLCGVSCSICGSCSVCVYGSCYATGVRERHPKSLRLLGLLGVSEVAVVVGLKVLQLLGLVLMAMMRKMRVSRADR